MTFRAPARNILKRRVPGASDGMLDASKAQLRGDVHSCLHVAPPDYHILPPITACDRSLDGRIFPSTQFSLRGISQLHLRR